jgi:4-amino-4-deoxy-L-arabinose transferase-like glycosyltransferase
MRISKLVTKIIIRAFFILLLIAAVPFFYGDQNKFQHIYFGFHHKWEIIFPAIILVSFFILIITCAIKKYNEPELNWLLVVNIIVLVAYGIAIFIRVSKIEQNTPKNHAMLISAPFSRRAEIRMKKI